MIGLHVLARREENAKRAAVRYLQRTWIAPEFGRDDSDATENEAGPMTRHRQPLFEMISRSSLAPLFLERPSGRPTDRQPFTYATFRGCATDH